MVAFMLAFVFAPFCAVFYPVQILPFWAQKIAWALPPTYIFEGMRKILTANLFPASYFWTSMTLNALYLTLSIALFRYAFNKSRDRGLGRFE
jgi:ABC-2 type transport system permease protein